MSTPISACMISRAVAHEGEYKRLLSAWRYNKSWGHFTQFGCRCTPPCPYPTPEQMKVLNARLKADSEDVITGSVYGYNKDGVKVEN
jgi:hypothetical protein